MNILKSRSIYYDNVNLIAQPTDLLSRKEIQEEKHRILVSPMQSIVGTIFAKKALELGITVCLHRFQPSIENRIELFKEVVNHQYSQPVNDRLWVSVGLKSIEDVVKFVNAGAENILIDMANGYMMEVVRYAKEIHQASDKRIKKLMIGNIHSPSMLPYYLELANELNIPLYYRCGIASGSACNTKGMTGYNRGQITEIMECAEFSEKYDNLIMVADGGIANPGCAAKAFGAGADTVIIGGYFAHAKESQHVLDEVYKFWGGASEYQQILTNGCAERHSEGKELDVNKDNITSLEKLVSDLWGGIASAVSYSGYKSLEKFIGNGIFELKQ